jgi:cytochrome c oxidase accessory protein FixG
MDTSPVESTLPLHQGEVPIYMETGKNYPRAVKGVFRSIKWWLMGILLAWWHLGPFLRWDRGLDAPSQAILIDMPGRRAYFFFLEIWPQEVYYVTGLLLFAAITLFMMSALAGRVWCGFLCWQTVYTDLFVLVERLVIGDRNRRIAFERQSWSLAKLGKKAAVIGSWLAIAAACGIGCTLWFGDAFQTLKEIFSGEAGTSTYVFIFVIGGFCFLLAGFARERVCVYLCPYSRFQAVMVDEHSLVVSYEAWRGEPRAAAPVGQDFSGRGHCVDCQMCVVSCPTGVDIRHGSQLACIGCGLCVDACNSIMDKFGLPRGLISYASSTSIAARGRGETPRLKLVRPRTVVYGVIMTAVASIMLLSLVFRSTTEVNVLHERAPLFVQLSDGSIRNGYMYKILNMVREDRTYTVRLTGIEGATMDVVGGASHVTSTELHVAKDDVGSFRIYVSAPTASLHGRTNAISFILTAKDRTVRNDSLFAGPDQ